MIELSDQNTLRQIYARGAEKNSATITNYDFGGSPYNPVEVTILDTSDNKEKAFWISDIDGILTEAIQRGDTSKTNPNLTVLQSIFSSMVKWRKVLGHPKYEPPVAAIPPSIQRILNTSGLNI
ncbi:MAG: hypothetical protein ACK4VI_06305 [Alphaproteobacteria bacterium]